VPVSAKKKAKYGLNALRHFCASLWIEANYDPERVQTLMGHASIKQTYDGYLLRKADVEALKRTQDRPEAPDHHPSRMGCKNSREHTFPYGDMVAAELETVPRLNSTDLLFPSAVSDDRPISGWSKYKKRLGDGVPAWRLHDLRRTFGTTLTVFINPD
jgi:integrase